MMNVFSSFLGIFFSLTNFSAQNVIWEATENVPEMGNVQGRRFGLSFVWDTAPPPSPINTENDGAYIICTELLSNEIMNYIWASQIYSTFLLPTSISVNDNIHG